MHTKICGRIGMYVYDAMVQQHLLKYKQKKNSPLCLLVHNLPNQYRCSHPLFRLKTMFSCALTSNISQPACFIVKNQCATLSVDECMKNNECRADFHRPIYYCHIQHHVWNGENRLGINFLDIINPQAACSLFYYIKT